MSIDSWMRNGGSGSSSDDLGGEKRLRRSSSVAFGKLGKAIIHYVSHCPPLIGQTQLPSFDLYFFSPLDEPVVEQIS